MPPAVVCGEDHRSSRSRAVAEFLLFEPAQDADGLGVEISISHEVLIAVRSSLGESFPARSRTGGADRQWASPRLGNAGRDMQLLRGPLGWSTFPSIRRSASL